MKCLTDIEGLPMIKKAVVLFLLLAGTAQAEDLKKVEFVRVLDGDTVEVNLTISVRLKDIDCYENHKNARSIWQAKEYGKTRAEVLTAGEQSEQALKDLLNGNENNLYLDIKGMDAYKRILGKMYIVNEKKKNINRYMLNKGGCLPYKPMPRKRKNKQQAPENI